MRWRDQLILFIFYFLKTGKNSRCTTFNRLPWCVFRFWRSIEPVWGFVWSNFSSNRVLVPQKSCRMQTGDIGDGVDSDRYTAYVNVRSYRWHSTFMPSLFCEFDIVWITFVHSAPSPLGPPLCRCSDGWGKSWNLGDEAVHSTCFHTMHANTHTPWNNYLYTVIICTTHTQCRLLP